MNREMQKNIPELEKGNFGNNITAKVECIRHADKDEYLGDITQTGERKTRQKKLDMIADNPDSSGRKIYFSPHKRPRRTAEILRGINDKPTRTVYEPRERDALILAGKISDEFDQKIIQLVNDAGGDEHGAIQFLINTGEERFDNNSISSKELSREIAGLLLHITEMTKRFKNDTNIDFVLISHAGVIENFLVDVLKKRDEEESLKAIGGMLDFLEGFSLQINRKDKQHAQINFSFRGTDVDLDESALRELAGIAKNNQ